MEATIITLANHLFTVLSLISTHFDTRVVVQSRAAAAAQHTPLERSKASALYVRKDRKDRQRVVSVFDQNGTKCYTIERKSRFEPNWSIYEVPTRKEIARLHTGFLDRSVDFHYKKDLQHREMIPQTGLNGRTRRFYLTDGAPYEWSRFSRYLERVVNYGGGAEEVRERVARARLMRQFRFDYELLIDESKVDREVVLATAFLSMITEWGLGYKTRTTGPTAVPKQLPNGGNVFNKLESKKDVKEDAIECVDKQDIQQVQQVENRVFLLLNGERGKSVEECGRVWERVEERGRVWESVEEGRKRDGRGVIETARCGSAY